MARRRGRVVGVVGRRRLRRLGAGLAVVAGLVVVVGVVRAVVLAGGLAVCGALVWGLVRWDARLFGPQPSRALVRPEVLTGPVRTPAGGGALGVEGHRAYARALHAVTGAYLAECEREAGR